MNRWERDHRDAAIEAGFWIAVAMLVIAVVVMGLLELTFGPPPPDQAVLPSSTAQRFGSPGF